MRPALLKFQKAGVRQIEEFDGVVLLADQMGLGKTAQSLYWAANYLPDNAKIVIICPASLKINWQREARKFCGLRAVILSGLTPPNEDVLNYGRVFIFNYDILVNRAGQKNSWLTLIRKLKPDLVICDECHMIKSLKAKRTKAVREICKKVKHKIMISGTPLTNRPAELFSALNILHPKEFPSFVSFGWRYCDPKTTPWGVVYTGAKNLSELHARLTDLCMIRRLKKDVLTELPDKIHSTIPLELSNRKEYDKAENDFIRWLIELSPEKARTAEKAEYLVRRGYLRRLAGSLKLKQVTEWITDFMEETDEKLIFFGIHTKFLEPLYENFKKIAVLVNGSVSAKKRQVAFDSFVSDKKIRLFVGNIQAAGVGWNGQVACHVGFGELPDTPGELSQAADRAHRFGQTRSVHCHYLVSQNTIEEKMCDMLLEKQKVLTSVLDGGADLGFNFEAQVDRLLIDSYKKKGKK